MGQAIVPGENLIAVKAHDSFGFSQGFASTLTFSTAAVLEPSFLSYKTALTKGTLCALDAPINAGGLCETETDCDGEDDGDDETAYRQPNKFHKGLSVTLTDQFGSALYDIRKPRNLLNPAQKNGEPIIEPNAHLRSYLIRPTQTNPRQPVHTPQRLEVTNQLGMLIVDTVKPDQLLVPSAKDEASPVYPPDPPNLWVDHFTCYQVKVKKNFCDTNPYVRCKTNADCAKVGLTGVCNRGLPQGLQVDAVDQFNQPKTYDVKKAKRLCAPADKNDEGVNNTLDHLLCYQIKPAKGEPKHVPVNGVYVSNQFGEERVNTVKDEELCLSSRKVEWGPVSPP